MRYGLIFALLVQSISAALGAPSEKPAADLNDPRFAVGSLAESDDFDHDTGRWFSELEHGGSVIFAHGHLDIDVPAGASVWFKPTLKGPLLIEYNATAISNGGPNDRVSDLNCFWMAKDSRTPDDLFATQRSGKFSDYDQLLTYYVGLGGNTNTTTRFRRYIGVKSDRPLLPKNDLRDKDDLLSPNKTELIDTVACDHLIQYYRDGKRLFELNDPQPYTAGWFAFRTTQSHLQISNFRVFQLTPTPPPPPFSSPADVYSGISGPGQPVTGDGTGGYRTGRDGVTYQGPNSKPGWNTNWGIHASGSAITAGLIPPIKPIWDLHLRDTIICLGGDGNYYMTGSSGDNIWDRNDGIELWRSADLQKWDYLGLVWSIDKDGTWQRKWRTLDNRPARDIWAPEIHYVKKNYYVAFCMAPGNTCILKSTTGKAEGPYVCTTPNQPLTGGIDATLFQDDDGKVYFTNSGGGTLHEMNDDMTGFVGQPHKIKFDPPADGSWTRASIAQEGASLFKANGKYYLGGAAFYKGRYSSVVAISDNIYGPYKMWHEAVPCGGGGNYFQDKAGHWFCTYFGNDDQSPWREKPGIIQIDFAPDGRIQVAKDQPSFILREEKK